jgi:hypothetical protein
MASKSSERRSTELKPLPKTYRAGERRSTRGAVQLRDPETGFYTRPALAEFIQYEIDGSAQTMLNELYVTPLCLAAVHVEGSGGSAEERFMAAGEAVRKLTRVADRVARDEDVFLLLLRRTLAKNVQEFYAPRLAETINDALKEMGGEAVLSLGIASLVEHLVRDPDDMVRKAVRALEEARKAPGSYVIYDFRAMPLAD